MVTAGRGASIHGSIRVLIWPGLPVDERASARRRRRGRAAAPRAPGPTSPAGCRAGARPRACRSANTCATVPMIVYSRASSCPSGTGTSPFWMPTGTIVAPGRRRRQHRRESGGGAAHLEEHVGLHAELGEPVGQGRLAWRAGSRRAEPRRELEPVRVEVDDEHPRAGRRRGHGDERADAADADDHGLLAGAQPAAPHRVHRDRHRLGEPERVERQAAVAHVDQGLRRHDDVARPGRRPPAVPPCGTRGRGSCGPARQSLHSPHEMPAPQTTVAPGAIAGHPVADGLDHARELVPERHRQHGEHRAAVVLGRVAAAHPADRDAHERLARDRAPGPRAPRCAGRPARGARRRACPSQRRAVADRQLRRRAFGDHPAEELLVHLFVRRPSRGTPRGPPRPPRSPPPRSRRRGRSRRFSPHT